VQVGAEQLALTDPILACVMTVAARGRADRLGATVQANLLRSPADADTLADAGVHIRLVKGAYVEATGAHRYGEPTDMAFLRLGFRLAERGTAWSMATDDGRLREALLLAHGSVPVEQLLGVRAEALTICAIGAYPPASTSRTGPTVPVLAPPPHRVPRRVTRGRHRAILQEVRPGGYPRSRRDGCRLLSAVPASCSPRTKHPSARAARQ
jgi:hypothetical protein